MNYSQGTALSSDQWGWSRNSQEYCFHDTPWGRTEEQAGPIEEEQTKVRKNEKNANKAMVQKGKLTSKRGGANYTKHTDMVLDTLGIGKSTVLNQLSWAAAAPFEARLAPWVMEVYMAENFCLK